jgi:HPt (histidine-containing phosphotransfer) domain-containing protein
MTFGDRRLEREVLQLFDRQSVMLVERMRDGPAAAAISCAHTLKGSARNIGAWGVARAAERLEQTAAEAPGHRAAVQQLIAAVEEARRAIASRLV